MNAPHWRYVLANRMRVAAASILWARDLPTVIVVTENLSPNERVRIATDDPVARDHIVRLHANARTESIIGVRLNIIGYGRGFGSFGSDQRGERHKHAAETNHHRISIRYHFH